MPSSTLPNLVPSSQALDGGMNDAVRAEEVGIIVGLWLCLANSRIAAAITKNDARAIV